MGQVSQLKVSQGKLGSTQGLTGSALSQTVPGQGQAGFHQDLHRLFWHPPGLGQVRVLLPATGPFRMWASCWLSPQQSQAQVWGPALGPAVTLPVPNCIHPIPPLPCVGPTARAGWWAQPWDPSSFPQTTDQDRSSPQGAQQDASLTQGPRGIREGARRQGQQEGQGCKRQRRGKMGTERQRDT